MQLSDINEWASWMVIQNMIQQNKMAKGLDVDLQAYHCVKDVWWKNNIDLHLQVMTKLEPQHSSRVH
jgi:hypothetical protein